MDIPLFNDFIIIVGLSIVALYICNRLGISVIVGFLLTGLIVGPHGLKLIENIHQVDALSEIGIILLLFTIGVELSLQELWEVRKGVAIGGSLQVLSTIIVTTGIVYYLGISLTEAIFVGFLISLSSTAIVLKILQGKNEINTPHGKMSLAILIFQDVIIVPMMLVTPLLSGEALGLGSSSFLIIAKGLGIILFIIVSAKWIVPGILYQVARTRNRELFLLSVIFICFSIAWLTASVGLSLSLGAFLAGLIISESEYSHQALSKILPFRDIFLGLFFVSVGMLLDYTFILEHPIIFLLIVAGVIILKSLIAGTVTFIMGYPIRTSILVGLALCQVGEFSLILSKVGLDTNVISDSIYQIFLSVSIVTMAVTSFIVDFSPKVVDSVSKLPLPHKLKYGYQHASDESEPENRVQENLNDHLIIVGYGFNGRTIAKAAKVAGIPYVVIETNPDTVKSEKSKGEPIIYGDATHELVLEKVNIKNSRIMILGISDFLATRQVIDIAKRLNPKLYIITRTHYLKNIDLLYESGADEVISQEFETSIEIFVRLLKKYLVPQDSIDRFITEVRSDGYDMVRNLPKYTHGHSDLKMNLTDIDISTFKLNKRSPSANKCLAELELRKKYGVTVLAIERDSETITNPHGDTKLFPGDIVIVIGKPEHLAEAQKFFFEKAKGNKFFWQYPY
ncbi:MAG: cation:proton antiporter [Methanohalobium sp.]|uniref:cation:proton antiporter domain-containing protein n=1 Tax=Methanohalobium sp. TaxID=2837493 RepID=UPI00397B0680